MVITFDSTVSDRRDAVNALVDELRPSLPLEIICCDRARAGAERFLAAFPGRVLFAVKCNSDPDLLRALWAGGVREFDVASTTEIELIRDLFPHAGIHFMHPVKVRADIAQAYHAYGVRTFAADGLDEWEKIIDATNGAKDVTAVLRLALPTGNAGHDLSGKFGTDPAEAAPVLARMRDGAGRVGLTFHVGSQCLDTQAMSAAVAIARSVVRQSGGVIDILDVGGGFAASYADCAAPLTVNYLGWRDPGHDGWFKELWCEPGRGLAAEGMVLVTQVVARKGQSLFLNDGIYGGLNPAPVAGHRYDAWVVGKPSGPASPFTLFGPTCDSHDRLNHAFMLHDGVAEGDWIAFDNAGAYASALRTGFNGLGRAMRAVLGG
jgi:ornithine decarboxylase